MKRILVVMNAVNVRMGGGITQVILNMKGILKSNADIHMDYAINVTEDTNLPYLLTGDGESKFFWLPNKKKHMGRYIHDLISICRQGYDCIHVHGSSSTMVIELVCAYVCGIRKRIAHSHNSKCTHPYVNNILNPILRHFTTDALACSAAAGEWLFGTGNYTVINNAFPYKIYLYCEETRKRQRENYKLEGNMVFGIVGNLNDQKNPDFSLEVFKKYREKHFSKMLIIGDGERKKQMEGKTRDWGLENDIIFLGVRDDVPALLQAIDVFLFPSKYEGLGISALEAQAAGCFCLVSDKVPKDTKVTDEIIYMPIDRPGRWIRKLESIEAAEIYGKRSERSKKATAQLAYSYDTTNEARKLNAIYLR